MEEFINSIFTNQAGVWVLRGVAGGIAGWLAGMLIRGRGAGLVGNILLGVIGSVLGGFIMDGLNQLGIQITVGTGGMFVQQVVVGFVGAVVLLLVARVAQRT